MQRKGEEETQPTLFVARPETERNFPGIMAGVSPESVRSALGMTLQQRFTETKTGQLPGNPLRGYYGNNDFRSGPLPNPRGVGAGPGWSPW